MIKVLTKKEVYIAERNNCIEKIACLEINILVLKRTDPDMVIGTKPAVEDRGKVIATTEVPAKDMLVEYNKQKEGLEIRLSAIESLI